MKPVTKQEIIEALQYVAKRPVNYEVEFGVQNIVERIQAHGIAPPDGWVFVPIEPTEEMMLAAEEAYTPFGDMGMALICGNLAAAPKQENSNE